MKVDLDKIIHLLKVRHELDISAFEKSFLEKVILTRMEFSGQQNCDDYLHFLLEETSEHKALFELLSNSYSEFFRNPITFAYLEKIILPSIINRKIKNQEQEIRIWSTACAAGQEPYSLAILCDEILDRVNTQLKCLIFATDKSENELTKAKAGIFPETALYKVSHKRIGTYFYQNQGNYTIIPKIKEYIDFSVFDLIKDPGLCPPASIYGNFDLILCSNILFYYSLESRKRILSKIGNSLAEGGLVITGEVERETVRENSFREVFSHSGIFKKEHIY